MLPQLFYIMGIDMSGVVVATCMQPSIPVITAMLVRLSPPRNYPAAALSTVRCSDCV